MTIKTHGRMMTNKTIGADQLAVSDYGTDNQALVTDGAGSIRWATVGIGGSVGSSTYVENIFAGDDSKTKFQMTATAALEESLLVFVDGVAQPTSAFTLSSSGAGIGVGGNLDEINISPALATGQQLRVCHLGINTAIADGSITGAKLSFPPAAAGDLLYHNGTLYDRFPIGAAGELFVTNASGTAPEWMELGTGLQVFRTNAGATSAEWVDATTATLPATGIDGNVLTSDGTNWNSETPLGGVGGELVSQQLITTYGTTTWTRPSGVKRIRVFVIGSGGGSLGFDNGDASPFSAGSGGGAACAIKVLDVSNLASAPVVIGNPNATTTAGRNASFNTTIIGGGGIDGGSLVSFGQVGNPGGPGVATGGDLNLGGQTGVANTSGGDVGYTLGQHGRGARGSTEGTTTYNVDGSGGCVFIEEYSDASAYLIGEKLVSAQTFTTNGTWTKPANITKIEVWVVGGGGNSSSGDANPGNGGGGTCPLIVHHPV